MIRIARTRTGIRAWAPAKLNLFLEVLGKRPDGYHEIETVMQCVDWCDRIDLERIPAGIELQVRGVPIPDGKSGNPRRRRGRQGAASNSLPPERNLCVVAAREFFRRFKAQGGVRIRLLKRIPAGTGMGGGSADAAAVLLGLCTLFRMRPGLSDLRRLAARLGSDVPFFLQGGTALCRGRGERVRAIVSRCDHPFVIVCPQEPLSTADVYRAASHRLTRGKSRSILRMCRALRSVDPRRAGAELYNRLEEGARAIHPSLSHLRRRLQMYPFLGVSMTGSGSAYFGLVADRAQAKRIVRALKQELPEARAIRAVQPLQGNAGGREGWWRSPTSRSSSSPSRRRSF